MLELSCSPSVGADPESKYEKVVDHECKNSHSITLLSGRMYYMAVDTRDAAAFYVLDSCLEASSQFIAFEFSGNLFELEHVTYLYSFRC